MQARPAAMPDPRSAAPGVYRISQARGAEGGLKVGVPAFLGGVPEKALWTGPRAFRRHAQFLAAAGEDPGTPLAAAVRGFFENGGRLCTVVPLPPAPSPEEALDAGLAALETLDDVDLVAAPGLAAAVDAGGGSPEARLARFAGLQQRIVEDCDRDGVRFALLDAPESADVDGLLRHRAELKGTNAALYAPWLAVAPRSGAPAGLVPPCGHVAGAVAATDDGAGVFKAPANIALRGVVDVGRLIGQADQDRLNPAGVNAIRAFPGRGIRIWGARTLSADPDWRYVNVRRLFMTAGRWMARELAYLAFEPHDARLWNRITRDVTDYLTGLLAAGALKGASAAEAFSVKCDAETNPPEVREAGSVVAEIGLAPAVPREFVVVRVTVAMGGVAIAALD